MSAVFEGQCLGKAVDVEIGADQKGHPRVRWNMQVTEGPHAGKLARYSGKLDPDNIKYTKRDMIAIGWRGRDVRTFVDDVKAANAVVPFQAEVAEYQGRQWTSARSIGFQAAPLEPLTNDKLDNVNAWFDEVGDVVGNNSRTPF